MERRETSSGIEIAPLYGPDEPDARLGRPGEFPYTRGPYPTMYRGRPWTMRQYAGFGDAESTNARFRALLAAGQTGISTAFDLPTQMGLDSDHPMAQGEVGRVGVAIDSIHDMRRLFDAIPLGEVTTSMTINATAPLLLLLYQLVAEEQDVPTERIRGTVQNDILKEYIARGTYIFPPRPSMRLITDLFGYCATELPAWNTISISGYHIREAGATAAEEVAFTLSNAIGYVEAALEAGLDVDVFAPRLSFFWNSHTNLFEEVAKFRAARRMWAGIMRDRFGATDPRSWAMRFHTQTAGSSLTAQQPEGNIVRTAIEALAAILGGTQSLHTNAFDEALGLPTEDSATLALRTQQILALEMGLTDTVDPLAGSYFVESLTDDLEAKAAALIAEVDRIGGAVAAVESGFPQRHIEESAYATAKRQEAGEELVVGVNAFAEDGQSDIPIMEIDPRIGEEQARRLEEMKAARDTGAVRERLSEVRSAAAADTNLLVPIREALRAEATIGEVCDELRAEFGAHRGGA